MPLAAAAIGSLAAGASQIGSSLINAFTQGRLNRKTRDFAREMYKKQHNDALSFWRMQNAYNTPEAQMSRFKAAGLNPNLIYGQGNPGNAGAIDVPSQPHWNPQAPDFSGLGLGITRYFDTRAKAAQINNLGAQNDLLKQQTAQVAAETANTAVRTARGKFDLGLAQSLKQNSLDYAKANLRKTQVDIAFQTSENERRAAMNAVNVKSGLVNMLKMRSETSRNDADRKRINAMIEGIRKSNQLKDLDINLKRMGVQPGDAAWMRILIQLFGSKLKGLGSSFRNLWKQ